MGRGLEGYGCTPPTPHAGWGGYLRRDHCRVPLQLIDILRFCIHQRYHHGISLLSWLVMVVSGILLLAPTYTATIGFLNKDHAEDLLGACRFILDYWDEEDEYWEANPKKVDTIR